MSVTEIEGRTNVVARLREIADAIEQSGGSTSMVCVIGAETEDHPLVYILGANAITSLMAASITLESLIESLPTNATSIQ